MAAALKDSLDVERTSQSMAMEAIQLKITTNLRPIFVVLTLLRFWVEPKTWLPQVDVRQVVDVLIDFLFQRLRQLLPERIVRVPVEMGMPNCGAARTAVVAVYDWQRMVQATNPARVSM